jgi:hypothetical protein
MRLRVHEDGGIRELDVALRELIIATCGIPTTPP